METRKIFAIVIIVVIVAIAGAVGYSIYREIARKPAEKGINNAFDSLDKVTNQVPTSPRR